MTCNHLVISNIANHNDNVSLETGRDGQMGVGGEMGDYGGRRHALVKDGVMYVMNETQQ